MFTVQPVQEQRRGGPGSHPGGHCPLSPSPRQGWDAQLTTNTSTHRLAAWPRGRGSSWGCHHTPPASCPRDQGWWGHPPSHRASWRWGPAGQRVRHSRHSGSEASACSPFRTAVVQSKELTDPSCRPRNKVGLAKLRLSSLPSTLHNLNALQAGSTIPVLHGRTTQPGTGHQPMHSRGARQDPPEPCLDHLGGQDVPVLLQAATLHLLQVDVHLRELWGKVRTN